MFGSLIAFWFELLSDWGYAGVIVLMALESSVFPVPSELVIPPAIYWASQGQMSFWGVVVAGTLGSWLGASITYWVARAVGRVVVVRYGKWFHISPASIDRAERIVHRYEAGGVFFARLLPVVRHVISIPAGLIRMDFRVFSVVTVIGSFAWCWILAEFSLYIFARHPGADLLGNPEQMVKLVQHEVLPLVGAILVLCALYLAGIALSSRGKKADE
ncbi:MAG: DedA family protein [Xanthomonadales bacterium]|nr:DedA family protein [Xanthomonadales bacterium]